MQTESYLLPNEDFKRVWLKTSRPVYRTKDEQLPVIFLGNTEDAHSFSRYANIQYAGLGFDEAKQLIIAHNVHDHKVIVVDIPLVIAELEKFSSFLKKETNSIIIYNKEKLTNNEVKFLKAFDLVDDAINIDLGIHIDIVKNANEIKLKNRQKKLYYNSKEWHEKGKEKVKDFSFLLKKIFDVSAAAMIILFLLPVFIFICIAIKLDSKGSILYSSKRAGKGYKIFKFYKFRSMVDDADKRINDFAHLNQYEVSKEGPVFFKLDNDPRVTRIGRFLRKTSLDELPQLFNILLGDMSLVGNRPLPLYEAATLTTNEFVERFSAPAGMTGFWQIKRRGKAEMSVKERVDLDIVYARKASPVFDLYIMANTPAALFQKSNV